MHCNGMQERTGIPIKNFAILVSTEEGITQVFEGNPIAHVPSLLETIEITTNLVDEISRV